MLTKKVINAGLETFTAEEIYREFLNEEKPDVMLGEYSYPHGDAFAAIDPAAFKRSAYDFVNSLVLVGLYTKLNNGNFVLTSDLEVLN